jgi:hypothetical protein
MNWMFPTFNILEFDAVTRSQQDMHLLLSLSLKFSAEKFCFFFLITFAAFEMLFAQLEYTRK